MDYLGSNAVETVSQAFGQLIKRFPVEECTEFYKKDYDGLPEVSKRSFLKAVQIPSTFFKTLSEEVREDIVIEKSRQISEKCDFLYFLETGDHSPVATNFTSIFSGDFKNAYDELNLSRPEFTLVGDVHSSTGMFRVLYSTHEKDPNEFVPGVYIGTDIFLKTKFHFNVGLFRLRCANGLIDTENFNKCTVDCRGYIFDIFDSFLGACYEKIDDKHYTQFHDYLKNSEVEASTVTTKLCQLLEESKIPKKVIQSCLAHLDKLEGNHKVPDESPLKVETKYDFINLMTFYTKRAVTLPSVQTKVESLIYNYFESDYKRLQNIEPPESIIRLGNIYTEMENARRSLV